MLQIARVLREKDHECVVCCPSSRSNEKKKSETQIFIGNRFSRNIHLLMNKITGMNGCFSFFSTVRFIHQLKKIQPDIIHLHNLHNCYVNLPVLFWYLKKNDIKTVWTLHDCWAFTGQCPHFTMSCCEKWKNGCYTCPTYKEYPESLVDQTKLMWKLKKKWFSSLNNLIIVTPSEWLANLVKDSFLRESSITIINNGIDLDVFKPSISEFKKEKNINNKYMILAVSFEWTIKKGLDTLMYLADKLDFRFQLVVVGTDEKSEKILPQNIIAIRRTSNQKELAELYSAADLFINPTLEENYPTVNMESLACGTPIVTYNTGGCVEIIDNTCGVAIERGNKEDFLNAVVSTCVEKKFTEEACLKKAEQFNKEKTYQEYLELFLNK